MPKSWGSRFQLLSANSPSKPSFNPNNLKIKLPSPSAPYELVPETPAASETQQPSVDAPIEPILMAIPATPSRRKEDRQDVFVGSLPLEFQDEDLREYLSFYPQVRGVKVVRNSSNGVCAFIQCESTEGAKNLLETIHSSPARPFQGRTLRFELARAARTLLISYRIPTLTEAPTGDETQPKIIVLEVPSALRMARLTPTSFTHMKYGDDARDAQNHRTAGIPFVYQEPVALTEDGIRSLVSFFGDIESFSILLGVNRFPHNAAKTDAMHQGVFEAKFVWRDDAIAALNSLRNIPHLSISWAEVPLPPTTPRTPYSAVMPMTPATPAYGSVRGSAFPQPCFESAKPESLSSSVVSVASSPSVRCEEFPPLSVNVEASKLDGAWSRPLDSDSEWQDLDLPPTPELETSAWSPVTPNTAQFPVTPTSANSLMFPSEQMVDHKGKEEGSIAEHNQLQYDPFSIFIGGISKDISESAIRDVFEKYPGIEECKLISPYNTPAAFCFIRFNNVNSPLLAVADNHNRVLEGRTLRVNIRCLNPPRFRGGFGLRGRPVFTTDSQPRSPIVIEKTELVEIKEESSISPSEVVESSGSELVNSMEFAVKGNDEPPAVLPSTDDLPEPLPSPKLVIVVPNVGVDTSAAPVESELPVPSESALDTDAPCSHSPEAVDVASWIDELHEGAVPEEEEEFQEPVAFASISGRQSSAPDFDYEASASSSPYPDWSSPQSAYLTPAPSTVGSSVSHAGAGHFQPPHLYQHMNPYWGHPPWAHAYAPQFAYSQPGSEAGSAVGTFVPSTQGSFMLPHARPSQIRLSSPIGYVLNPDGTGMVPVFDPSAMGTPLAQQQQQTATPTFPPIMHLPLPIFRPPPPPTPIRHSIPLPSAPAASTFKRRPAVNGRGGARSVSYRRGGSIDLQEPPQWT